MSRETLVIEEVDTQLLDSQRLKLVEIIDKDLDLTVTQRHSLNGVINLLNEWSDKRYHKEEPPLVILNMKEVADHMIQEEFDTTSATSCDGAGWTNELVDHLEDTYRLETELSKAMRKILEGSSPFFWNCSCAEKYVHRVKFYDCPECGTKQEGQQRSTLEDADNYRRHYSRKDPLR